MAWGKHLGIVETSAQGWQLGYSKRQPRRTQWLNRWHWFEFDSDHFPPSFVAKTMLEEGRICLPLNGSHWRQSHGALITSWKMTAAPNKFSSQEAVDQPKAGAVGSCLWIFRSADTWRTSPPAARGAASFSFFFRLAAVVLYSEALICRYTKPWFCLEKTESGETINGGDLFCSELVAHFASTGCKL